MHNRFLFGVLLVSLFAVGSVPLPSTLTHSSSAALLVVGCGSEIEISKSA